MNNATLYILSGLPGSGKSSLAKELVKAFGAAYLRVDTIEQALRDLCELDVEGEGYELSYRVASDNLKLGQSVIADSCNPIELTRNKWNEVATNAGARFINIEIVCSDKSEHRTRIEKRSPEILGLALPTWDKVVNREYDRWKADRIVIDTANKSVGISAQELVNAIHAYGNV